MLQRSRANMGRHCLPWPPVCRPSLEEGGGGQVGQHRQHQRCCRLPSAIASLKGQRLSPDTEHSLLSEGSGYRRIQPDSALVRSLSPIFSAPQPPKLSSWIPRLSLLPLLPFPGPTLIIFLHELSVPRACQRVQAFQQATKLSMKALEVRPHGEGALHSRLL